MAELWRYQDRLAAGLITKRPRAELDNAGSASAGYGRGDFRFDERDARLLDFYAKAAAAAYSSVGLTGADITGLGDGTLLGAGVTGRVPSWGLSGLEDPRLSGLDPGLLKAAIVGLNGARSEFLSKQDTRPPLPPLLPATLFVEGLPRDCTRREAAHIFRPFRGFKEVRLVKKTRREGGEKFLLGYVDFEDPDSATKACEALQGYKFDEDDHESEPLKLQFAREQRPRSTVRRRRRR